MVAHAAIAVLAALVITGSVGAAAMATGMLHTGGVDTFNLGTLSAGSSGNVTISSSVDLNSSGVYHLQMEKEDHIGNTFSNFSLSVSVNGTTYNLNNGEGNDSGIMLSAGNHTFHITLHYTVRNNVVSSNETGVPFLYLHPSDDRGNLSDQNESHINDSAGVIQPADSNLSQTDNGNHFVLAYITFNVQGTQASHGDDSGTDSLATRQIA